MAGKERMYRLTHQDVSLVEELRSEGVPMYFAVHAIFGWSYEQYKDRADRLAKGRSDS